MARTLSNSRLEFSTASTLPASITKVIGLSGTLTEKLVDWPGAGIDRRIVATSNPLIAALPHVLGAGQIVTSHIHSPGDDGSAFSEHIRKGAIALIVGSKTPAQQASTTRLLLAQSAHGVKTYEFQMPQPPGQN